ncbi:PREDICTED: abscission/NoCut checkpoint regulator isoform X2 [Vollenhovia emeryi]|uniref:abscission/NoCut checkpoint regulator isoform X2 n=1 Tax=Vollenhovia emeryi TaxID=411798 RepID=UPI0005F54012|nr:PREDICTED: abscission/NoCut checkpoint regulator isoform X2 [Vollenhovia emeryi]
MSCNTCQAKFSFFTKDIGCPGCGYSCCGKCLKYKCDIPDVGRRKVCGRCYAKSSSMKKSSSTDDAAGDDAPTPDAYKEPLAPIDITMKLDSLENPVKVPIVIYKHTNRWDKLKTGLEPADQQIVDRLRKLKDGERNIPLPTFDEIEQRLALLKDQNPEAGGGNVIDIHRVDTRTDQEKADDLVQEYLAQVELPSTSNLCKDIQGRLDSLRDNGGETRFDQGLKEIDIYKQLYETTNDAELVNKVSAMEIETPPNAEDKDGDENEDEGGSENECVVCSRTANESDLYRCTGCTGDLYCPPCFESSHDEREMLDKHKAVRFIKEDKRDNLSSAKMSLIRKLLTSDNKRTNH